MCFPEELEDDGEETQVLFARDQKGPCGVEDLVAVPDVYVVEGPGEAARLIGRQGQARLAEQPAEEDDVLEQGQARASYETSATSASQRGRRRSTSSWYLSRKPRVDSTTAESRRVEFRWVSASAQSRVSETPGSL